ncbi:MAG: NfeD family protein [Alphaproteobacteria bacterium]|nr:NfeD family protein [Alphaproteobacteria bacterium]
MDTVLGWLDSISFWHWWALGVALLILEVFTVTMFLIGPAIAAGLVGLLLLIVPDFDWRYQFLVFALLAVAASVVWQRWVPRNPTPTDHPGLNMRAQQYVGRRVQLHEDLTNGRGRIHLDDSIWIAETGASDTLAKGQTVEVVGSDGATLKVRVV